ncbi:class I SAM-dependent methyltransferase [Paracoccus methylovorus]|uniref:Class I SAM-dependent methyltransferase n=1 Tax=Paracoccus methylovorus TaxID=2812658 RepID=A0ABX7JLU2_9RHOB|nr:MULTISPECIES: methyltransferase [Paracoccus]QRZ14901.1 class I SAM-dependent methyltransferase [Paracoccus methylovorus]
MAGSRLELIFGGTPPEGRMLLIGAGAATDLGPFDPAQVQIVQGYFPDYQALKARGYDTVTQAEGKFDGAVVFLPRARAEARARIAQAAASLTPGASLWIDGQKTDGVDAVIKEMRGLAAVDQIQSRAHGKIFRVTPPPADWLPEGWAARDHEVAPGMVTRPGVFSADGPDPASQALAAALPDKLPTRIVDLGAGWGWLSAEILKRPGVEVLHLVEADATALECARRNVRDLRAHFHWADARDFHLPEPVNGIVMNPPFHEGRAADPRLGAGFIRAAAGLLTGAGRLWMVANRHLPYEQALRECFAEVSELGGDSRFKILTASGARRPAAGRPQPKGRRR